MKLLYLAKFSYQNKEDSGILKKIIYQQKAIQNNNINVNLISTDYSYLYFNKDKIKKYNNVYKAKLSWIKDSLTEKYISENDLFYIRNSSVDFGLVLALNKIKHKKIILEIPTYPYDGEKKMNSLKNIITIVSDKISRVFLKKSIHRIVTYSEDKEIWGIPCINISNGIDLEEVQMVNKQEKDKNKIVFTSVSNCSFWHGIDRFLISLEEYGKLDSKKEIKFNIVGEGSESAKLKEIVSKSEYLSKVVNFAGFKSGEDLDHIYDETSIAVGCLGNHRKGIYTIQALKNKE
ncbi:MAG: glycosyltransferase, partial [Fusobacteriaceae bacterium]